MNPNSQFGLSQALQAPRPSDLFDEYRQAAERFNKACQAVYAANVERMEAEKILQDLSQKVNATVQSALQDPTVPQVASAPANGRW